MKNRIFIAIALCATALTAVFWNSNTATATPPKTVWISELQVIWGPSWSANPGDTVNMLAYVTSDTDTTWIGRCADDGGFPVITNGVRICGGIDF